MSLATLGTVNSEDGAAQRQALSVLSSLTNPYTFLTNGARAVRAFCRPWPVKTIGIPADIQFDISKTLFKLVVRVRAEDRLQGTVTDEDDAADLATEIFVPLVHYAHPRLLSGAPVSQGGQHRPEQSDSSPDFTATATAADDERNTPTITKVRPQGSSFGGSSSSASTINLETVPPPPVPELPRISVSFPSSQSTGTMSASTATASPLLPEKGYVPRDLKSLFADGELIDVEVSVSGGRWAIEGQVLKWWYDAPMEGEPDKEYTIEVKRNGGMIKKDVEPQQEHTWSSWTSLCDGVCPENGCTVM